MGRIGHTSSPTHYGHTGRHTRHPSRCLPSGTSSGKPATFRLSYSIRPTGPSKSSTSHWTKQGKNDFSNSRSYRNWGTTSTKMRRFTRTRPRPSTTDISDDDHSRSTTRSGSTTRASNSSLESCAPDGMVPMWFWNCSTAEQYSSQTLRPVDNSR